jgi:hypothetical protein
MLQTLTAFLLVVSPSRQRRAKVPLVQSDAEEAGGDQWQQKEQKAANITTSTTSIFEFFNYLNQIPDDWLQLVVRFRRANGIRDGDRERSIW